MLVAEAAWATVLLVFGRVSGLMLSLPVVGSAGFPRGTGVMVAVAVAWLIAPGVPSTAIVSVGDLALSMGLELMLGALIGLVVQLAFATITFATDMASVQMGFAMAQQLDPVSRASVSVPARLATLLAGAVFLGAGLHLECLMLIRASFMVVPPGAAGVPWDSLMALTQMGGDLFFVGVRLGGPIVALVWMINVFVGVLAKLAPRMNVFFSVGMTVTSVVGIIVLALATPMMLGEHLEVVGAGLIQAADMLEALR